MKKALVISLGFMLVSTAFVFAQPSNSPKITKVTFLDGSSCEVHDLRFIYEWVYSRDERYINPPIQKTPSQDLHYATTVGGTKLDTVIARRDLERIQIDWKVEGSSFTALSFVVTTRDGKKVAIKKIEAVPEFLAQKPIEQIKDPPIFRNLYVEGIGVVNGRKGRFQARIPDLFGANITHAGYKTSEALTEMIFY